MKRVAFWGLVSMLVACGGAGASGGTTAHEETASTSSSAPELTPPPRPWAELSHDERRAHMVQHVLPAATDLFTSWRPDDYEDFGCDTCHGADAGSRDFAMPNPALLTLYPTGTVGQQQVLAENTEACTFMFSRLVPAMQTLLAAPEFDPRTHQGFSCFSCHPSAATDDPRNVPAEQ